MSVMTDRIDDLRDLADDVRVEVEPAARSVARTTVSASRRMAGWLALVPGTAVTLLGPLQRLLERLSEQGREVAATIEPPRRVRRRRALRSAGWFAGGFALGAATGWIAHLQLQRDPEELELHAGMPTRPGAHAGTTASPYAQEAAARNVEPPTS